MPDESVIHGQKDDERDDEKVKSESSATLPGGDELDRKDLDDPQSPNHPMVPPHRVDAADDQTAGGKREGQAIHDDAIAAMKRGETVDVSEQSDQGDVSGTASEGASSSDEVAYKPPDPDAEKSERENAGDEKAEVDHTA